MKKKAKSEHSNKEENFKPREDKENCKDKKQQTSVRSSKRGYYFVKNSGL